MSPKSLLSLLRKQMIMLIKRVKLKLKINIVSLFGGRDRGSPGSPRPPPPPPQASKNNFLK